MRMFGIPAYNVDWLTGGFLAAVHIAFLAMIVPYLSIHDPPVVLLAVTAVSVFLIELLGVGAYHRFYSHRAYSGHPIVEAVYLVFGTLAIQGSVIQWSFDHRRHHRFTDTALDPYSVHVSFWHAHMGWLLTKRQRVDLADTFIRDLAARPLLVFQHRFYVPLTILLNAIAIGAIATIANGVFETVVVTLARVLLVYHLTWFINSLAHYYGERTFTKELSAVDNYLVAFFTVGEGYHNYHHTFPSDYRNGIRWYHFDPGKWLVWTLSKLGLTSNLRRIDPLQANKQLVENDDRLIKKNNLIELHPPLERPMLAYSLERLKERIVAGTERIQTLKKLLKDRRADVAAKRLARKELRGTKQQFKQDMSCWKSLVGDVLRPRARAR